MRVADLTTSPEIGRTVDVGGIRTNYLKQGEGSPLIFLHGSGPGVTAYANWRLVMPRLARHFSCYAPDVVGFGYTDRPSGFRYGLDEWIAHVVGFMDACRIDKADVVGNSFGGALAVAMAVRHPDRVDRLILMGSVAKSFPLTEGLDAVWGYRPSIDEMKRLVRLFAYDPALVTPDLVKSRYDASIRPSYQESYEQMFPPPRQRHLDALATADNLLRQLRHRTLLVHGREDQIIPVDVSWSLSKLLPNSELHVFSGCGHWTQIEKCAEFCALAESFLLRNNQAIQITEVDNNG
jgi:2-hydroxymuconate-semialdehyde hydrolase